MIQPNGTVIQLLYDRQYDEAVFKLECMLMDKKPVEIGLLDRIPDLYKQNAPMLLKYQGEFWLKCGKLVEAESVLRAAAQGFVRQTFQSLMLDVLARLALIHLRIGQWAEARSMLIFLNQEWIRNESPISGIVLQALAKGSYLLPEEWRKPAYFSHAWNRFIEDGDIVGAMELCLDQLLYNGFALSRQEQEQIVAYMEQKAKLEPELKPMWHLAAGIHYTRLGDTEAAIASFEAVDTSRLSYEYTSSCLVWNIGARLSARLLIDPLQWNGLQEMTAKYEVDLDLQFQAGAVQYRQACMFGDRNEAARWLGKLTAWQQLADNPMYTAWLQAIQQMDRDDSASSKPEGKKGWTVYCFGKMKFIQGDNELEGLKWKRKKALELFVYLLIQPELSATKEQVMEALMGSSNLVKMSNQMYVIIHQLKQTLKQELDIEPGVIVRDGHVRLNEELLYPKELEQYQALIQAGDRLWESDKQISLELYEQAAAMYGVFIPEIRYSDWLNDYREAMAKRQAELLHKLATHARELEQFDRAAVFLSRKIELSPLEEDAYQELIQLLSSTGRKKEARRWLKKWEKMCQDELGILPTEETQKLLKG